MSKYCPQCSETAPSYAKLCRHCFFDFKAKETPKKFPLGFSLGLLALSVIALALTQHLASSQIAKRYILDVETQSLLIAEAEAPAPPPATIKYSMSILSVPSPIFFQTLAPAVASVRTYASPDVEFTQT